MSTNELRRIVNAYFGETSNRLLIMKRKGRLLVDVEYEDFRSEPRVEAEIRSLIGEGTLLNVKRRCSVRLMERVSDMLCGDPEDLRLHLMETIEMP